mmetsp:Transcript_29567/g.90687  ORF Transcript_29567/g.90687 Transcript_29567/m.90687 type:complete len:119 (+) Transcript_29567:912-1268(+)
MALPQHSPWPPPRTLEAVLLGAGAAQLGGRRSRTTWKRGFAGCAAECVDAYEAPLPPPTPFWVAVLTPCILSVEMRRHQPWSAAVVERVTATCASLGDIMLAHFAAAAAGVQVERACT